MFEFFENSNSLCQEIEKFFQEFTFSKKKNQKNIPGIMFYPRYSKQLFILISDSQDEIHGNLQNENLISELEIQDERNIIVLHHQSLIIESSFSEFIFSSPLNFQSFNSNNDIIYFLRSILRESEKEYNPDNQIIFRNRSFFRILRKVFNSSNRFSYIKSIIEEDIISFIRSTDEEKLSLYGLNIFELNKYKSIFGKELN